MKFHFFQKPGLQAHSRARFAIRKLVQKRKSVVLLFFLLPVFFSACSKSGSAAPGKAVTEKPLIALSILPQRYFVSKISGGLVDTMVLAGPGQNPHSYDASPRQIEELSGAAAWILSGTEFEIGLKPKVEEIFPDLKIIDGVEGFSYRFEHVSNGEESGEPGHSAEEDGGHDHSHDSEIDRHIWLGLEGAKLMALRSAECLSAIDGANSSLYMENYRELVSGMEAEFKKLRDDLAPLWGQTVFVYHPGFGYFLDEFSVKQEAVESGGKEPSPRQLGELIAKARRENVKVIFVQEQFPSSAAETVARAAGVEILPADPLAEDWFENIRSLGEALKKTIPEAQGGEKIN